MGWIEKLEQEIEAREAQKREAEATAKAFHEQRKVQP